MNIRKYFYISIINFKNSFVYLKPIFFRALFIGLIVLVYYFLWKTIFLENGSLIINGYTLTTMIWYLVLTEAIYMSISKETAEITRDIQNGNIANYLIKPYNYIFYRYFLSLGKTFFSFLSTLIVGGLIAFILVGGFKLTLISIPFIILAAFLGTILHFIIYTIIGIFAFWFEETKAINFIYSKFVFVLGGMLIPIELFPLWLHKISNFTPFIYVTYFPAKLFVDFNYSFFIKGIFIQIFWVLFAGLILFWMYRKGIKKININGG